MRPPTRTCFSIAAAACPAAAVAGPYSGRVVFGDSLSDVGNDAAVTAGASS